MQKSKADASCKSVSTIPKMPSGGPYYEDGMCYTTQICNKCGEIEKKPISQRQHCCIHCGYKAHRDHNAFLKYFAPRTRWP